MTRTGVWVVLLVLTVSTPLRRKIPKRSMTSKEKIWEAQLVQRNFAAGLRHCNELNGTNFYFDAIACSFCRIIAVRWTI
jgi:hypothetical protein